MPSQRHAPLVLGLLFLLAGLCIGTAGVWLMALGGSWYYLPAGLAWVLIGLMLLQRNPGALWVHAALLTATLAWSLWEAGFEWWPLAARADVLFLLGLLLLSPWVTRGLAGASQPAPRRGLAASLALVAAVGVATWVDDAHFSPGHGPALAGVTAPEDGTYGPADALLTTEQRVSSPPRPAPEPVRGTAVRGTAVGWTDLPGHDGAMRDATIEITPLKIGNRLVVCTPQQSLVALDATTGAEVWRYHPQAQGNLPLQHLHCHGLAYHAGDGTAPADGPLKAARPARPVPLPRLSLPLDGVTLPAPRMVRTALATSRGSAAPALPRPPAPCAARLLLPTADGRLLALNPQNGARCSDFGAGRGEIDLAVGMPPVQLGGNAATPSVIVTRHLVIAGSAMQGHAPAYEPPTTVSAFDARTGALVWHWDTGLPESATPPAPMALHTAHTPHRPLESRVDEALGLVYVPLGHTPPDLPSDRRGKPAERYSSSVVALALDTGRVRWQFQTVQHALWQDDVPAQPTLVDLQSNGTTVPALVQPTQQGEVFVLDRRTGMPLPPLAELAQPMDTAVGDATAPAPPRVAQPVKPPRLTGADMWGVTLFDQLACRIAFERLRFEGRFTPALPDGAPGHPGTVEAFHWASRAVDPQRRVTGASPTSVAFTLQRVPQPDARPLLAQDGGAPRGPLPVQHEAVGTPYAVRLKPFLSPLGMPCQTPPWGTAAGAGTAADKAPWNQRNGPVRGVGPAPLPLTLNAPPLDGPLATEG